MTKSGEGTLTLTGNNKYNGVTTVNAGTLQIGDGGTTGSVSGYGLSVTPHIVNNGNVTFNRSDAYSYNGRISGTGSLTKLGDGTLYLQGGLLTYTGGTTVNGGTLQINGAFTGDITNNANVAFGSSGLTPYTYEGVISGSGSLTKSGSGNLTLSGNNTYNGATTISYGTLTVTGGLAYGDYAGNISNSGLLVFNQETDQTLSGIVSFNRQ